MRKKYLIFICFLIIFLLIGSKVLNIENILNEKDKKENGEIISKQKINMREYVKSNFEGEILKKIQDNHLNKNEFLKIRYISNGLEIAGYIVKPKKDGNYPVIIFNRGGNREFGKIDNKTLIGFLSYYASKGYVIVSSQYREADGGEGKDEFGGKDVNDVLNLIPLVKNLKYANDKEIGMLGVSRGGMMTYLAIKENINIETGVILSGISNLISNYDNRDIFMKKLYEKLIGDPHSKSIEEFKKRSAYYWPEKIDIPILIMHGKKDKRVDYKQAKNLAKKLDKLDKEYKLKIYPNGVHGLRNIRYKRDSEILSWFDNYLK